MSINQLLEYACSQGASDLHLVVSRPPIIRIDGRLFPLDYHPRLTADDIEETFASISREEERERFKKTLELDFSYSMPGVLRARCNAARQRKTISLALRLIPWEIPTFEQLHLPEVCASMVTESRGMVVISGPTGSGKSTTLAAMINYLNTTRDLRIVTIEDPIEYVYVDDKCTISQRQIGDDTLSFADALKHVLRHDPDVVLIGEMRDAITAGAAISLAETGHIVLTTGHAPTVTQTVERIIDLFPPEERFLVQARLSTLLAGVICQKLVPSSAFKGRVPAVEVMQANAGISNIIREGKLHQMDNMIRANSLAGMQLMDQSLVDLYKRRIISGENLVNNCNDRVEVDRLLGGVALK